MVDGRFHLRHSPRVATEKLFGSWRSTCSAEKNGQQGDGDASDHVGTEERGSGGRVSVAAVLDLLL